MKFFKPIFLFSVLFLFCIIIVISCKKKSIQVQNIQIINSNTTNDLHDILFLNDSVGYIVGGVRYTEARILETIDGGNSWQAVSINGLLENKALYGLGSFKNQVYAVGLDGKIFKSKLSNLGNWSFSQSEKWEWFQSIAYPQPNKAFIAYGVAFHSGGILMIDSNGVILKTDTFEYEMNDIQFPSSKIGYACGYGAIMKTTNEGANWELLNIQGDFFKAITCVDELNIWSVGYNGSIVRSSDGGANWVKQRNGNNPTLTRWRLRAVAFKNKSIGYAVGDKGLIIKTTNGGDSWQKIESNQKDDFSSITLQNNHLWVVGSNGIILKIKE